MIVESHRLVYLDFSLFSTIDWIVAAVMTSCNTYQTESKISKVKFPINFSCIFRILGQGIGWIISL